jgi:hypothetical protein
VNVFDEIPQSYSHKGNIELDQTRYTIETRDHEYVDLEVVRLFLGVCAFCEEEVHVIMDYPFVPFHIRLGIVRHVELQNVARTLLDQSQEQEAKILIAYNRLRGMELGNQFGLHSQQICPFV